MKLLTKTTLYYVTISLFIFFILGIGIYQLVKRLEDRKVNQELNDQRLRFTQGLGNKNIDLSKTSIISSGLIQLYPVPSRIYPDIAYRDTFLFDEIHKSYIPYRSLSFYLTIGGALYHMSIYKSLFESNYLIEQVALVITSITFIFLLTVYFLYRYSFGRIWSDFFTTIDKIHHFNLSSPEKLDFPTSAIIEFNQLNEVLKKMIDRISNDFEGLREFTGNLTHEIQTPLAVIRSRADLLLQDQSSNENQMQIAGSINAETVRLSKLVKALSFFTKLDYRQFSNDLIIDIGSMIRDKFELFDDFVKAKELNTDLQIIADPHIKMDMELADILFTNLIKNSIRHNIKQGKIFVRIDSDSFSIKNTGEKLNLNPDVLFERFNKLSKNSESLGIGLSLVKKICDYYGFSISYLHSDGIHELIVKF